MGCQGIVLGGLRVMKTLEGWAEVRSGVTVGDDAQWACSDVLNRGNDAIMLKGVEYYTGF